MFEGHPSWRSIIGFYIGGLALSALVAFVAALLGAGAGTVFVIALIGVALTLLAGLIRRIATDYTITNRRLHIKRGIISREIQETRLERVQNVNYSQSIIQRLLQIGDVDFDTAGSDDYDFVFAGVADPEQVVESVDRAVSAAAAGPEGLGSATG